MTVVPAWIRTPLAVAGLAGLLAACTQYNPEATTGALVGGASGAAIGGATTDSAEGALIGGALGAAGGAVVGRNLSQQDQVRCQYDPRYGRDVCYRY